MTHFLLSFRIDQNSLLTWTDETPFTYQAWLNIPSLGRAQAAGRRLSECWTSDIRTSLSLQQPSDLYNCTVLFQLTADVPMWVTVPCAARLNLGIVICEYDRNPSVAAFPLKRSPTECLRKENVFINNSCYNIYKNQVWLPENVACGVCPLCDERLATIHALDAIAPYLEHILGTQPKKLLLQLNQTTVVLVRSDHYDMLYSDVMESILHKSVYTGYYNTSTEDGLVCETDTVTVTADTCIHGQHQCDDGTCILDQYACDGSPDCPDGSDEKSCTHVCTFFGMDLWDGRDCFDKCLAIDCSCSTHYFQCNSGKCVPWSFVCNGRDDCRDNSDEVYCSSTILNNVKVTEFPLNNYFSVAPNQSHKWDTDFTLTKGYNIPESSCVSDSGVGDCGRGSGECFPKSSLCLFEKNLSNGIRYCSQGGHLLSCQTFKCPTMFKCPESYCIPLFAVCNGDPDCPNVEDEVGCHNRQCRGLLYCIKDKICVHPNNIVDGELQCLTNMDDEQSYQHSKCPDPCHCKGHSINCATKKIVTLPVPKHSVLNLNLSDTRITMQNADFENYPNLLSLDLSKNEISKLPQNIFQHTGRLMFLHFDHNLITILSQDYFLGLNNLIQLDILHNPIMSIHSDALSGLKSIGSLYLSNLGIFNVIPFSFNGLGKCSMLALSQNNIRTIPRNTFNGVGQLRMLDLRDNPMEEISRDAFPHLEKLNILVPFGQFCCSILVNHCNAPSVHVFSFCHGYITDKRWSIYVCVVAGMILLLNVTAIILNTRGVKESFNKLFVSLQVISNGLSCLPLVCFVLIDYMLYSGILFSYSDTRLRKLPSCLATSFLFAFCFYTSLVISVTEMLHKYVVIALPLKTKQFESSKFFPIWAFIFLLVILSLSLLAIIHLSTGELQAINSSCTAFGHGRSDSIALATIPILSFYELCLVFMVSITLLTIRTLLDEDKINAIAQLEDIKASIIARNRKVALRLIIKAIGHLLCPGIFIIFAILNLAGAISSVHMSALVTRFVFPITPLINPIINTLLNKDAKACLVRLFYLNTS